jgi:transcriptional antiterminator NusG
MYKENIMEEADWHALFVKTGDEENVRERINYRVNEKFKVVIPKRILKERKKGIWSTKEKIMFPGYVLLKGILTIEEYYKFNNIPGIINFLKAEKSILKIRKDEVYVLERLLNEGEKIGFSKAIIEGKDVNILEGPLKGMEGQIVSINKRKSRAKVNISFMDNLKTVELGVDFLQII